MSSGLYMSSGLCIRIRLDRSVKARLHHGGQQRFPRMKLRYVYEYMGNYKYCLAMTLASIQAATG